MARTRVLLAGTVEVSAQSGALCEIVAKAIDKIISQIVDALMESSQAFAMETAG
jgi:hypothetical protein